MKFNSNDKGRGAADNNPAARVMMSKSPDGPWSKPTPPPMPGISHDVWKRYTDSRLRSFEAR